MASKRSLVKFLTATIGKELLMDLSIDQVGRGRP
jgi:hypothetical protein